MSIAAKRSRAVFGKLDRDLARLGSKPQAENVHGFRTGTRRLQILVQDLSPDSGRSHKKLLKSLGSIRKRAGKVRDLDVQLAALRSLKMARQPRRKTQLVNHLIELRDRQEKKLRKELDRETVRDLRKRLKRTEKNFDPEKCREPLTVARAMIRKIDGASAPVNEAVLHQYRILSKRARYAAEFAERSPEAERFIAGVKRVQDALGDWHDWLILSQTAKEHLGEVSESPLVAELQNVTGAKFRRAVAALTHMRSEAAHSQMQPAPSRLPVSRSGDAASAA
jgi:CHAD domain-containing protein